MLEIYNETIRDLLDTSDKDRESLKIHKGTIANGAHVLVDVYVC